MDEGDNDQGDDEDDDEDDDDTAKRLGSRLCGPKSNSCRWKTSDFPRLSSRLEKRLQLEPVYRRAKRRTVCTPRHRLGAEVSPNGVERAHSNSSASTTAGQAIQSHSQGVLYHDEGQVTGHGRSHSHGGVMPTQKSVSVGGRGHEY
ncbi:hypothetical protein PIIN_08341 [Serendipita indica DSM 11827]|uniref:Uncharacterized protein n=1 Tax=Serendipita indica (strain DSM 11827) TaxID=1109443 RepID=G4TSU2_SERID|nr:hypothetical protein PIIN_08341 [Serendipita indica DSM 11827]